MAAALLLAVAATAAAAVGAALLLLGQVVTQLAAGTQEGVRAHHCCHWPQAVGVGGWVGEDDSSSIHTRTHTATHHKRA